MLVVLSSPKVHDQEVIVPVEVSVNCTVSGTFPLLGVAVKLAVMAVQGTDVVTEYVREFDPHEFVAVSFTVNVPALV